MVNRDLVIRDLDTIADLKSAIGLEKEVWACEDADVTPLAIAMATRAAGSLWIGAFDGAELIGFAFAFLSLNTSLNTSLNPSLDTGAASRVQFHSDILAVKTSYRNRGVGYRLKLAQRERALAIGVTAMTWTFDPLRSRNAHLNFQKLGVICDSYRADFYGPRTSSPVNSNSTDRMWVTWRMADSRVEARLKGKGVRAEVLDALAHVDPLVRFNGNGRPAEGDLSQALARLRIVIEIPGDIDTIERDDRELAREWRLATRRAFTEALNAGFIVKEFCRSVRGQQGPGAYLLERSD
jgi:predicted GNAT superfamily acetyltransferase